MSILVTRDRAHLWHPYAPAVAPDPLLPVRAAARAHLVLDDHGADRDVVDAMASWWCQIHGYRHPVIDAALHAQIETFSHVMFGGLTHEPAIAVAEDLSALTGMGRVFLADSGSVGVEVALKLARQVALARHPHQAPTTIAALTGAYHGDTLGAMSVCDPVGGMHAAFADSIPAQLFLPSPPAWAASDEEVQQWVTAAADLLQRHRTELAAVIVEPILQGAGGMWSWSPSCLTALRQITRELGILLIADEIATGFGRTGRFLACEWAAVVPDILVLGKALTGGYLTQAAVLVDEALAAEVSQGTHGVLMHGPTFMANPLACSASRASLALLGRGEWTQDVRRIEAALQAGLEPLRAHDLVADVRVLGATAAVQLHRTVDVPRATRAGLDAGVWLRPFRDLVYAMPPYVATDDDLAQIVWGMTAAVLSHEEVAR